jgi:hypothetical protein
MIFRLGRCKRAVGDRGGFQRIKQAGHTAIWEGIGRLEKKETGTHVPTSLAKFLQIIYLMKFKLHLNFSFYSSLHIFLHMGVYDCCVAIIVHSLN